MPAPKLPAPSPELVICRVAIEALVEVLGAKKGERLLNCMAEAMASEERLSEILRIRPAADDAALRAARRDAMHWFRQALPTFMARL